MGTNFAKIQVDENMLREVDDWRTSTAPEVSQTEAVAELLRVGLSTMRQEHGRSDRVEVRSHPAATPSVDKLAALYALEGVSGFGPVKFREMHMAGVEAQAALERPELLPFPGRIGDKLRAAVRDLTFTERAAARDRAAKQVERAEACSGAILVHGDVAYPKRVYASNNPVAVLYVRGDAKVWTDRGSVAVVGSRKTREPYASAAQRFATAAVRTGLIVVSGFALGADSIGHRAARDSQGYTVCVMPCGVDNVFPPENRELWEELLACPRAAFVSEFGFGQRASALHLRKRNKLIVAFAQGVLVAQSGLSGGAMNAYRFGREQKKPVATFESDGPADTDGNSAIAEDPRVGGTVFQVSASEACYEKWLSALSSSI